MDATIVLSELESVLASLRKNRRWALGARMADGEPIESPMSNRLKELRHYLTSEASIPLDTSFVLGPFLEVVTSEETTGPMTAAALVSVLKMLDYGLISVGDSAAASAICEAATHCKFEATDAASDEVVLMRILHVLAACVEPPIGPLLPSASAIDMVTTTYRIGAQQRLSELLRTVAEDTLHTLVKGIFTRARELIEKPDPNSPSYGLDCITEIMKFLASLAWNESDENGMQGEITSGPIVAPPPPSDGANGSNSGSIGDDATRILGLHLLAIAIESVGPQIAQCEPLMHVVRSHVCPRVYYNARTSNLSLLHAVCHLTTILKECCLSQIKLEFMVFITGIMVHTAESTTSSYEQVEMALEYLTHYAHMANFGSDLYYNYDCDIRSKNVFEDLCKFLSKNAFPVSGHLSSIHLLSLDAVLGILQAMSVTDEPVKCDLPEAETLRERKQLKHLLNVGAAHFNRDFKKGLSFLQGVGLLADPLEPSEIARFLRHTSAVDKTRIGIYVGEPDQLNLDVLEQFVSLFDFHNMRIDNALRQFLSSFLLPGEGQKIGRVMEHFASHYHDHNPDLLVDSDAAYLLAYSVIMLHTDHHNRGVKTKMTQEQFIRNNRGLNGGNDLPQSLLISLYESITQNEIRLPHMVTDATSPESRWIDSLGSAASDSDEVHLYIDASGKAAEYCQDMFTSIWGPAVAAFSVVFEASSDPAVLDTCMNGFMLCAKIAAKYRMFDVFDNLIISLCKTTTLLAPPQSQVESGLDLSLLSIGSDPRAQKALVTAFSMAKQHGSALREGWLNILNCVLRLRGLKLIPDTAATIQLPVDAAEIADASAADKSREEARMREKAAGSLFSTFTSYLSLGVDDEEEAARVEATRTAAGSAQGIVEQCDMDGLFGGSGSIQGDSIVYLVKALILSSVWPPSSADESKLEGTDGGEEGDVVVFCLELLASVTFVNRHRIVLLWMLVHEHLTSLAASSTVPDRIAARAGSCILRLCTAIPQGELASDVNAQLVRSLGVLLRLTPSVETVLAPRIATAASSLSTGTGWSVMFDLLDMCMRHGIARTSVHESLAIIVSRPAVIQSKQELTPCLKAVSELVNCSDTAHAATRALSLLDIVHTSLIQSDQWEKQVVNGDEPVNDVVDMWLLLCSTLQALCLDTRPEVRAAILRSLQHVTLSAAAEALKPVVYQRVIVDVIFGLFSSVLSDDITSKTHPVIEETRLRVCALYSQVFVQYLAQLQQLNGFGELWLGGLRHMVACMQVAGSDLLAENVPEYLRHLLLTAANAGALDRPDGWKPADGDIDESDDSVWAVTWAVAVAIGDGVKDELLAATAPPPEEAVPDQPTESQETPQDE